jgi:hypothetical protein
LKPFIAFISGLIVCALGVYFTLDWQEEKIRFSISSPAKFGEINYQNFILQNTGWNPAKNLKIKVKHPSLTFKNLQSESPIKELQGSKGELVYIDRLRRDETVVISLAYKGSPLTSKSIIVTSDRSIAESIDLIVKRDSPLSIIIKWLTTLLSGVVLTLVYIKTYIAKTKGPVGE